jgi:Bacterial Ig-like domain (group 1)/Invasin, domain 3/Bacterial Ig-like domain (group 2)/Calcineurin-like phosphoesterase
MVLKRWADSLRRPRRKALVYAALLAGCAGDLVGPGAPVASVEVSTPAQPVGAGDSIQLVATPKDSLGRPLSNKQIVWSSSDTSVAVVNASGWVTGRHVGSAVITATSEQENGTATVNVVAGPAVRLSFTGQPTAITAGVVITPAITVTALDVAGNTATDFSGAVTIALAANPGGATLSGTTTVPAAAGITTFSDLTIDKSGAGYTLVATSGSLSTATSAALTISAGVATQLAFTTQPAGAPPAAAGASLTPPVVVVARDAFGNLATGYSGTITVSLGANPAGGTLSGTTSHGAVSGAASFADLSLDKSGTGYTLVASAPTLTGATSNPFAIVPGSVSATQSTIAVAPGAIPASAGASRATVTVTARDAFGNRVPGASVLLAATGNGDSLTQPSGPTDATGVAIGSLSATVAETKTLSATAGGVALTPTATLTVNPAAAAALVFLVPPSTAAAGNPITPAIQVAAQDGFGNLTTALSGSVTIKLGANPGAGTLTGTLTRTAAGGVAAFNDLAIDKVASGYTLIAQATGLADDTSSVFAVTAGGISSSLSTVVAVPSGLTASSGSSAATITIIAKDAFGNPVPGATVILAASGGGNGLTQPAAATNALGVTTGSLSSTAVGLKIVSATVGGVPVTQRDTVTVGPATATTLAFTVQPANAGAGAIMAPLTVSARDPFGNTATAFTGQVTVAIATNPSTGTLTGTRVRPAVNGVVTFDDLSIDKTGSGYTLKASATGVSDAVSDPFSVSTGAFAASRSSVVAAPATINASAGTIASTITVTARDTFGNPLPGLPVVLAATGSGNTLVQPGGGGLTNSSGIATGTISSTAVGRKIVSATINGIGVPQTDTVAVKAGSPAVLTFTTPPGNTAAGATINSGTGVKVTVQDAFGNTDSTFSSGIKLKIGANPGSGTLSGNDSATAINGVATMTNLSIDRAGNGYTLRALSSLVPGDTGTSPSFDITPGPPSANLSTVTADSATLTASNGSHAATIAVVVVDALSNPIPNAVVLFSVTGTGGGDAITPADTTDGAGHATATFSSTGAGSKTIMAAVQGVNLAQHPGIAVIVGPVSTTQSTITASPTQIESSQGAEASTITVAAKDAFGNAIPNATVSLTATPTTGNALTQPATVTDAGGLTAGTLSSTTIGDKLVRATINGVQISPSVTITVVHGEASASLSTISAPASITASSGSSLATITVTARDEQGNPDSGVSVVLTASGSGNTLTQPLGLTNASGIATGTLSSTVAEAKILSASVDNGTGIEQMDTLVVNPAAASKLAFVTQPSITQTSNAITPPVQVSILDQFGNLRAGATNMVTLAILNNPGSGTLSGTLSKAAVAGVATFADLSINLPGNPYTLQATSGSLTPATSAGFEIAAGAVSASNSTVSATPSSITAGGTGSTVTVTVKDAGGTPLSNVTVTLAVSGSGNTITQPAAKTNVSGVATGSFTSTGAGTKTVSATADGVGITQTATVTVAPGAISGTVSTLTAVPGTIVKSSGVATITVTALDPYGNPVRGAAVVLSATPMAGNNLTQPSGPTNASGVATGTLSSSSTGIKTVSATADGTALTTTRTVTVITAGSSVTFVGAGDMAICGKQDDEATAALVTGVLNADANARAFTLGDNVYEDGTTAEFNNCYNPSWGAFKSKTYPSAGNHDYNTPGATGYYGYFATGAAINPAGPNGQGYYSFDLGAWHIIVLNSNLSGSAETTQESWLQSDLSAHPNLCTLAYWHHPLYSSVGGSGSGGATISSVKPFWDLLYAAGADVVLNGHRHVYETFQPMKPDGTVDNVNGIQQIIAGTGGDSGGDMTNIYPTSITREGRTYGVLKLTLLPTSYLWQFIPVAGSTFTDSGSGNCH